MPPQPHTTTAITSPQIRDHPLAVTIDTTGTATLHRGQQRLNTAARRKAAASLRILADQLEQSTR